jgi:hypothetical protein
LKAETLELLTEKWVWFIIKDILGETQIHMDALTLARAHMRAALVEAESADAEIIKLSCYQLSDRRQLFPFHPEMLVQLEGIDCEGLWKRIK